MCKGSTHFETPDGEIVMAPSAQTKSVRKPRAPAARRGGYFSLPLTLKSARTSAAARWPVSTAPFR